MNLKYYTSKQHFIEPTMNYISFKYLLKYKIKLLCMRFLQCQIQDSQNYFYYFYQIDF